MTNYGPANRRAVFDIGCQLNGIEFNPCWIEASACDVFNDDRNSLTATNTHCGSAQPSIFPAQLMDQFCHQDRTGGSDRMSERDRAAIGIDLLGRQAQLIVDRAGLRCKGFV